MSYRATVVKALLERDGETCVLCGHPFVEAVYEIDHMNERKNGGSDSIDNLRLVHPSCHRKRHGWSAGARKTRRQVDSVTVKVTLPVELVEEMKQTARSRGVGISTITRMMIFSSYERSRQA